jgi:hypothetical protein
MRTFINFSIVALMLANATVASAFSGTGEIPCSDMLKLNQQNPEETKTRLGSYLFGFVDGVLVQRVWVGLDELPMAPDYDAAISYAVNYCEKNRSATVGIAATAMAGAILKRQFGTIQKRAK